MITSRPFRLARAPLVAALALPLALGGCIGTAAKIVTAPVRVASKGVDLLTTSQSEADEKRGREMRKRDEAMGKLQRTYQNHLAACDRGEEDSCEAARDDYARIQELQLPQGYAQPPAPPPERR